MAMLGKLTKIVLGIPEPPRPLSYWAGKADDPCRPGRGHEIIEAPEFNALVQRIDTSYGYSSDEFYAELYPSLLNTAEFCQMLPASTRNHDQHPGGLVIHSFEVCDKALTLLKDFTELLPTDPDPPEHEIHKFEKYGRLLVAHLALAHDFGKIAHDYQIYVDGKEHHLPYYNPHANGRYRTFVTTWLKGLFGPSWRDVPYRFRYINQEPIDHSVDIVPAANALFSLSGFQIPDPIFLDLYLDDRNAKEHCAEFFRGVVLPFVKEVDRTVTKIANTVNPSDSRHEDTPRSCRAVLRYWARNQHLVNLPVVSGSMFLPLNGIPQRLSALPPDDDFQGANLNPRSPKLFLMDVQGSKLALAQEENKNVFRVDYDDYKSLHTYDGAKGLFLTVDITTELQALQRDSMPSTLDYQSLSSAASVSTSSTAPHTQGSDEPDFRSAVGELDQPAPTSQDVSSYGDDVPPPPDDIPTDHFGCVETAQGHSTPPILHPDIPEQLVLFASHLEKQDISALLESGDVSLVEGVLIFHKPFWTKAIRTLEMENPSISIRDQSFRSDSEKFFTDRWIVHGHRSVTSISCSRDYSHALQTLGSTSPLLVSIRPPVDQEHSPESVTKQSAPSSKPTPPPDSGNTEKHTISYESFLAFLSEWPTRKDCSLVFPDDENVVGVPLRCVDSYLWGNRKARGQLLHFLRQEKVFIRKTSNAYFLDLSNPALSACLKESAKKT
jgi:hypothetical protein